MIFSVITPIGVDQQGEALNINADTVVSELALALTANVCYFFAIFLE